MKNECYFFLWKYIQTQYEPPNMKNGARLMDGGGVAEMFFTPPLNHMTSGSEKNMATNAPFRKISNSTHCGRSALILWRLVKGSFFWVF